MAGSRISINIDAYVKDRYWNGWWWDRNCLYDHRYDAECKGCQRGSWYYTSVAKTGMPRFGKIIGDTIKLYAKGRVYHYGGNDYNKEK